MLSRNKGVWLGVVLTPLVVAFAALVATGSSNAPAAKAGANEATKSAADAGVVSHLNAQSLASIENYWTAERKAAAKPYPLKEAATSAATADSSGPSGPSGALSGALPGGKLLAADLGSSTDGGSAGPQTEPFHSAAPITRYPFMGAYLRYPASTVHKMFYSQDHDGNGTFSNFVCSSSSIGSDGVWTAGHCVNNGLNGAGANGGWSTNVQFCPSFDNGVNPARGCWGSNELWTLTNWLMTGSFDEDMGGADPFDTGTVWGAQIGNVTGWLGFKWNWPRNFEWVALGYPQGAPFNGQKIQHCASHDVWTDDGGGGPDSNSIACDMTGGSSGGPWVEDFGFPGQQGGGGGNYLNGHNDWRHTAITGEMNSPYFDCRAIDLYNAINETGFAC